MNIAKKDERLEYLRVISCVFVVLGHIFNWYMREFPHIPIASYIVPVILNGISRISVPIFFMISGALLLEQPIDFKKNTKRTLNILVKTIVWSLIYIIWDYLYLGEKYFVNMAFEIPVRVHFWFMYVMVGIYLTTPLWQKLVSGESKKLMLYFSIVFIFTMATTFLITCQRMNISYQIPLLGSSFYACYFIMGYVIRHYHEDIKIKTRVAVCILTGCIISTDLLTYFYSVKYQSHIELFSNFGTVFTGVAAMAFFYLFMKAKNLKHRAWISAVSKHSFNIYMMHVFFLDILQQNIDVAKVSSWFGIPAFFIILFSLSFAMSWLYESVKGNINYRSRNKPIIFKKEI